MEPIIAIVGFLGSGKTTFMRKLCQLAIHNEQNPHVIINDYENAKLDAQQFSDFLKGEQIDSLSGSCICCSGIVELRSKVNDIPWRENGLTLIEANGTSDACELMGFLAVGIQPRFLPPIQISIVDARHWQKRGSENELEANQVQVSSLIILNRIENAKEQSHRIRTEIASINPMATIIDWDEFEFAYIRDIPHHSMQHNPKKMNHLKSHWSACSVPLKDPISSDSLNDVLNNLPKSILRVKGCTKLDKDSYYSYFERIPSGETFVRPYRGNLIAGPQLLTIGPGSEPQLVKNIIQRY